MQEIRCPKCGEVFQVDETGYDQIARQVRDKEFIKEIERRERELYAKQEKELELIRLQEEKEYTAGITKKEAEISAKDQLIAELQAKLDASETAKNLAISEALEMIQYAYKFGYAVMPSDSRGEGESIADYAVGINAGSVRECAIGDRGNRFLAIEEELGASAKFIGAKGLKGFRNQLRAEGKL